MFTCFANIELGVEGGEFFSGGNSVEIHIVLFDARGVHDNTVRFHAFYFKSQTNDKNACLFSKGGKQLVNRIIFSFF